MTEEKKECEELLKKFRNHAKKNGFHLNPDQKIVDSLIKTLVKREKKYGKKLLSLSSSQRN